MGQHDRIAVPHTGTPPPDEHFGVLVGWSHLPCGSGINLKLQSARSQEALRRGEVDASHLLLTRNQALLLARYLLQNTNQSERPETRPHGWRAAWSRLRGR